MGGSKWSELLPELLHVIRSQVIDNSIVDYIRFGAVVVKNLKDSLTAMAIVNGEIAAGAAKLTIGKYDEEAKRGNTGDPSTGSSGTNARSGGSLPLGWTHQKESGFAGWRLKMSCDDFQEQLEADVVTVSTGRSSDVEAEMTNMDETTGVNKTFMTYSLNHDKHAIDASSHWPKSFVLRWGSSTGVTTGDEPLVHVPNGEDTVEGGAFGSTDEEIPVAESIATCKPKRNVGKLEWLTKAKAMVAYALPIVEGVPSTAKH
ncbi:hypothetical protein GIB67_026768 [Kingdonia uniflora]|uniref:Uncharacterized protein n=1 Tax=Kingdonia uniflora TaxID=39325 RepID=A0A7J7MHM9_9MAGN|nr:hypothetical protein GIB67_026768 [Kingdonia uniflora]